jgi:hypothetical protein
MVSMEPFRAFFGVFFLVNKELLAFDAKAFFIELVQLLHRLLPYLLTQWYSQHCP